MALKDETNNRYGKLLVLNRDFSKPGSKKNGYWLCKCDCGNTTIVNGTKLRKGETKSCGCLKKESKNFIDMTGQKFGKLLVLEKVSSSNTGLAQWKCQCDCGNITIVTGSHLRNGHTQSCGCLQKEVFSKINIEDITNQRFGKLIALERTKEKKGTNYIWKCICDCGEITYVDINSLTQGKVKSCGCLGKSFGEFKINEILEKNNIKFEEQKTFDTCRFLDTNSLAKFDFYIENKYLIEFDGQQHFYYTNNNGWNNKNNFEKTKEHDNFKNNWCKENNIPLIRIPYTHLKDITLEDLMLETSKFII